MKFEVGQLVYVDGGTVFWAVVARHINKQGIRLYWLEGMGGTKNIIADEERMEAVA